MCCGTKQQRRLQALNKDAGCGAPAHAACSTADTRRAHPRMGPPSLAHCATGKPTAIPLPLRIYFNLLAAEECACLWSCLPLLKHAEEQPRYRPQTPGRNACQPGDRCAAAPISIHGISIGCWPDSATGILALGAWQRRGRWEHTWTRSAVARRPAHPPAPAPQPPP